MHLCWLGVAEAASAVDIAEADTVQLAVVTVGRPVYLPREAAAMRTCCAVGKSFEAEVAGFVHAVANPWCAFVHGDSMLIIEASLTARRDIGYIVCEAAVEFGCKISGKIRWHSRP
jgi:hypothetical protein